MLDYPVAFVEIESLDGMSFSDIDLAVNNGKGAVRFFLSCRIFGHGSVWLFVVFGDVDEAGGEVELCPGWCLSDSRDGGISCELCRERFRIL